MYLYFELPFVGRNIPRGRLEKKWGKRTYNLSDEVKYNKTFKIGDEFETKKSRPLLYSFVVCNFCGENGHICRKY